MVDKYIPYDLAVKLHQKGFNRPVTAYYNIFNKHLFLKESSIHSEAVWAPTYEDVVMWFKEKYNLIVDPTIESIESNLIRI